jgi:hypothetical protein
MRRLPGVVTKASYSRIIINHVCNKVFCVSEAPKATWRVTQQNSEQQRRSSALLGSDNDCVTRRKEDVEREGAKLVMQQQMRSNAFFYFARQTQRFTKRPSHSKALLPLKQSPGSLWLLPSRECKARDWRVDGVLGPDKQRSVVRRLEAASQVQSQQGKCWRGTFCPGVGWGSWRPKKTSGVATAPERLWQRCCYRALGAKREC